MSEQSNSHRIAILGASSQIARDLIVSFSKTGEHRLFLFARRPEAVEIWLGTVGLAGRYPAHGFVDFARQDFDSIINFVGVGDPAKVTAMGGSIFDVTLQYDQLALEYLNTHHACRYLFISSGAAYGSNFEQPATRDTQANVPLNGLAPSDWYGIAKLHAECRHRAHPSLAINDIRVFNYFSRSQNLEARFLISDILRSILSGTTLETSPVPIVRDYINPADFCRLVKALLTAPENNTPVDCYSLAPVDKSTLLAAMRDRFGLRYEVAASAGVNATGSKPNYYSLNTRAADFGYKPSWTSLDGILYESQKILSHLTVPKSSYDAKRVPS